MSKQQVALDMLEEIFGVRLEAHHIQAMARTTIPGRRGKWQTKPSPQSLFDVDSLPWAEILRQAYQEAKSRRRSRAERRGTDCHKTTDQAYPGMPEGWERRCCRQKGHEGKCSPGVERFAQRPWEQRNQPRPTRLDKGS